MVQLSLKLLNLCSFLSIRLVYFLSPVPLFNKKRIQIMYLLTDLMSRCSGQVFAGGRAIKDGGR